MKNFNELQLNEQLITALAKEKITIPTKIQQNAITPILENKDVIGEATTGSGKTLAYVLPAFQRIEEDSKQVHTLILAPSHELVLQIHTVIKKLAKNADMNIRSVAIMGNVNIKRQIENLKSKPQIVVGTPGRVLELIKAKKLKAHFIKTIVIDEADKLLSKDNTKVVHDIIKTTLKDRQLLAFSASIKPASMEIAKSIMKEPTIFHLKEEKVTNDITHFFIRSSQRNKIRYLRKILSREKPKKAMIFLNKNEQIQELNDRLNYHSIPSVCIFGNATKAQRKSALDAFRSGKANVLISSDLLARGLDFKNITHVINMDLSDNTNEYIHRVGRTGRAGNKGTAISILTDYEQKHLQKIMRKNHITIEEILDIKVK